MIDFTIKTGDSRPILEGAIGGPGFNPYGATITLILRDPDRSAALTPIPVTVLGRNADDPDLFDVQVEVDGSEDPGLYMGGFRVVYAGGGEQTIPTVGYIVVYIEPNIDGATPPIPTYTTTLDLIEETREHLRAKGVMDQLAADVNMSQTDIQLTHALKIDPGDVLSLGVEDVYVWDYDKDTKTATVQRGHNGSKRTTHATGALVWVSPRFSNYRILRALNAELSGLAGEGIHRIRTVEVTAAGSPIPLPADATGVLEVRQNGLWITDWQVVHDPTTLVVNATGDLVVRYTTNLGLLTTLFDDATATGLPETAVDIPPLGAAIRIMAGSPVERTDMTSQPATRIADEVKVGDLLQAPGALRVLRSQRISEEAARLRATTPILQHRRRLMS